MTQMGKLRQAEVEANLPRSASHGKAGSSLAPLSPLGSPGELDTRCAEQPGTCQHLSCTVTRHALGLLVRARHSGVTPALPQLLVCLRCRSWEHGR